MAPAEDGTGNVTIVIATYCREQVLVDTVEALLAQKGEAQLLVVDQTPEHTPTVQAALETWERDALISIERQAWPSIPRAMNLAILRSQRDIVLFFDDDIVPGPGVVQAHAAGYVAENVWAVAGQVLQPGEAPSSEERVSQWKGLRASLDFRFNSMSRAFVKNGMSGNLSVRRVRALEVGGFDENFRGVAYRFETEFCRRLGRSGGRVLFEPAASIRHLRAPRGGIRSHGNHRSSPSAAHGVGDYYFALRCGSFAETLGYIARRPLREVSTRFHLTHPWWIPVKLWGELVALGWALWLAASGPSRIAPERTRGVPG